MVTRRDKAVAREAWQLIRDFFIEHRDVYLDTASEHGLNPGVMNALLSLDPEHPKPMRSLADAWHCDASNVTWLVDRLEERGLVERRTSSTDRRVKTVVLTDKGEATAKAIRARLDEPPAALLHLDLSELSSLRDGLSKLRRT